MERPQSLKNSWAVGIIILFHAVGLAGFLLPDWRWLFIKLVPFHLYLMMLVLFLNHHPLSAKFRVFMVTAMVLGFIAEQIGVHTQLLFGDYAYGATLGRKWFGVPVCIGVNWFLLTYGTGVLTQRLGIAGKWLRIVTGAAIMILLDVLIEPVAIRFDYWHWADGVVPLKNYICWALLSITQLWIFEAFELKKQDWTPAVLVIVQFVFFGVLRVV